MKAYYDPTDEAYQKLCRGEISEKEYRLEIEKRRERVRRTGSPFIEREIEIEPERINYDSGHPYR